MQEITSITKLPETAEAYFEYAIEIASKDDYWQTLVPALYEYGKYLYEIDKQDEGIEKIEQAKEIATQNNMLGELRRIKNEYN